jgi:tetratricopeptide (TPR) repeat protein
MRHIFPAVIIALLSVSPALADDFAQCKQDANAGLKLTGCANIITKRPDMATAYCGRGDALVDLGRTDEAITDYTHALFLDGKLAAAYYNRGLAYLSKGKATDALTDFDAATKLDGSDATAQNARAMALGALGDAEAAEAGFGKAIGLNPGYVRAYLGRATLYLQSGKLAAAAADFDTVLRLHPGDREALVGRQLASAPPSGTEGQAPTATSSLHAVGDYTPAAGNPVIPGSDPPKVIHRLLASRKHHKLATTAPDTTDFFDALLHIVTNW